MLSVDWCVDVWKCWTYIHWPSCKIYGTYYHDVVVGQNLLTSHQFHSWRNVHIPAGLSARSRPIAYLSQHGPAFIPPWLWPPDSPDLDRVDNEVRGLLQRRGSTGLSVSIILKHLTRINKIICVDHPKASSCRRVHGVASTTSRVIRLRVLYCVLCFTVAVCQPLNKLMMMVMMMMMMMMRACVCTRGLVSNSDTGNFSFMIHICERMYLRN